MKKRHMAGEAHGNWLKRRFSWVPRWVASGLCLAAILWLTLSPKPIGELELPLFPGADNLVHGIMFGGLSLCLWWDLWRQGCLRAVAWATILAACIGAGVEVLQWAMHLGRSFEVADIAADAAGAFLLLQLFLLIPLKEKGSKG